MISIMLLLYSPFKALGRGNMAGNLAGHTPKSCPHPEREDDDVSPPCPRGSNLLLLLDGTLQTDSQSGLPVKM